MKLISSSSSSFHRLDMTLAVAEALNPNKPNQTNMAKRLARFMKQYQCVDGTDQVILKPIAHCRTGCDKTGQDRPVWQCAGLQDGLSLVFRTVLSNSNVELVRRDRMLCACIRDGTRRVSEMCAGSEDGSGPPWRSTSQSGRGVHPAHKQFLCPRCRNHRTPGVRN